VSGGLDLNPGGFWWPTSCQQNSGFVVGLCITVEVKTHPNPKLICWFSSEANDSLGRQGDFLTTVNALRKILSIAPFA
jgi:hypothetical protein